MKATQLLHNLGQSIWLDNITRDLLDQGTLKRYIDELSVTGLTSNPTIFEHAIKNSASYDVPIREKLAAGRSGEDLFFDLALEDITRAADLFLPIHEKTNGVDGWEHYLAAAEAFHRGIERRLEAGANPNVGSVASVFVSRWDTAVVDTVPLALHNQLGIAMAQRTYKAARTLLTSPAWQRVYNAGARPQRLLWASTGTKDPSASDILYVKGLAAPFTVNTMPEGTLNALAGHNELGSILPADGGDCEEVLARFVKEGVDLDALAAKLQDEGAKSFVKSWNGLMAVIASKSDFLKKAS